MSISFFKWVIVAFWAVWWLLAFLTDVAGGLKELGLFSASWLSSTNYQFMLQTLAPFGAPHWLSTVFFIGIIAWSGTSTVLLSLAALTPMQPQSRWRQRVNAGFIVSLGLWFAFYLADQVVMKFDLEENHMVQGGFQFLCFMALHLLPDDRDR